MTGRADLGFRVFANRRAAGVGLGVRVAHLRVRHPVVLALPRGGVPVAAELARALDAPLDVIVVRKLGVPSQPELAMGAIGEDGARVVNQTLVRASRVRPDELAAIEARERVEVERRATRYRAGRSMTPLRERTVIVV